MADDGGGRGGRYIPCLLSNSGCSLNTRSFRGCWRGRLLVRIVYQRYSRSLGTARERLLLLLLLLLLFFFFYALVIIIKNECHSNIIVDSFDPSDVDGTSRMCVVCIARGAIDVRRKSDNILCYVCQNTATHELNM